MKFFLIIFIAMTPLWAQKSVGPETFQVQVRPVLNSIVNDFYQMVALFPHFPQSLTSVINELNKIQSEKEALLEKCPQRLTKECSGEINRIRSSLLISVLQSQKLMGSLEPEKSLYINSQAGSRTIQTLQTKIESIKGDLDNLSLVLKAEAKHKKNTFELVKSIDELNTYASLSIIEFVPFHYQADFRHFYFNFIHPIELHVSKKKNYEFLNRNINSLNFALNLLNQNLTKRNKKTPEGMAPYLSLIHNKWNSLLRYYF